MNLQEQISRMQGIMGLISENENINPNNLKFGDREPKEMVDGPIHKLQQKLIDLGLLINSRGILLKKPTGYFGPLTRRALQKYESGNEAVVTVDDKTNDVDIKKSNGNYDAILIGGLDTRRGDLDLNSQVKLFKSGFGSGKNVKGFRYSESTQTILDFLKQNPNTPVFMFSAGCAKASSIANSSYVDKLKVFIIEPHNSAQSSVQSAVDAGVPSNNVFVGTIGKILIARGYNIVSGCVSSGSGDHWGALKTVGSKKSSI